MRTWTIVFALVLLAACGKDDPAAVCSSEADCAEGQTCNDGVCTAPSEGECNGNPDCEGGFECVANMCVQVDLDMGPSNNRMDMAPPNNNNDDMNFDNIPPQVVSVTPTDQTIDVGLDTSVVVVFNEALRETSVNIQSIELRDPANTAVAADISYDAATFTVTLSPQAPLRQATPYRLVVTTFVRDAADNALPADYEVKFYTAYAEPAGISTLAATWAPHIYQTLGETSGGSVNVDIPTVVNFDNNQKARDNKSKARLGTTRNRAYVYYNVVESKSHYFLLYSMYYPLRLTNQNSFEHDFAGALMVVDKATDTLVLVDAIKVQNGADTNIGFRPSTSTVSPIGQPQFEQFDVAALEDGTHFPLFVPAGEHEACAFPIDGSPPYCLHNGGEFPGAGLLLKPGTAQMYSEAVAAVNPLYPNDGTAYQEMTYELVPLPSSLWVRRTDVGSELLWQQTMNYTPTGDGRPATTTGGAAIVLPTQLWTDDATSFGKPPFQWNKTSTENNPGQWLIDPAYLLLNKYDFGATWSQEYCFNIFLDVNLRGDAANPECGTDP